MTTGNVTIGSSQYGSPSFSYKSWSGADGRTHPSGKPKCNNYHVEFHSLRQSMGLTAVADYGACTHPFQGSCYTLGPTNPWDSNAELALLSKLSKAARASEFNLAVFAAQGNKLVEQTVSTVTALSRSVRHLRRFDLSGALRAIGFVPGQRSRKAMKHKLDTGDISGTWLAMQYGWLPTLSDIYAASEAYEKLTSERSLTISTTGMRQLPYNGSQSPSVYGCTGTRTVRKRISFTQTENISVSRSLGLTDPLSVVWELLPFSFVADWFIPIGTYLENLNVIPHLQGTSCVTIKDVSVQRLSSITPRAPYPIRICNLGSQQMTIGTFTRTCGGGLSVPPPNFVGKNAVRGTRILNAAALFHQLLR